MTANSFSFKLPLLLYVVRFTLCSRIGNFNSPISTDSSTVYFRKVQIHIIEAYIHWLDHRSVNQCIIWQWQISSFHSSSLVLCISLFLYVPSAGGMWLSAVEGRYPVSYFLPLHTFWQNKKIQCVRCSHKIQHRKYKMYDTVCIQTVSPV